MTDSRKTLISAEALSFSSLLQKGRFSVPWHQRYYDWESKEVQELLQDIDEAIKEGRGCYFLGAIILIKTAKKDHWEINDGQQRMITLSLIYAALCRKFKRGSQREGIALRILFELNANSVCTLDEAQNYTPRIIPPSADTMHYEQMIRGNDIGTNGKLTVAWTKIDEFFDPKNIEEVEEFFDFLTKKIEIAYLEVPQEVDPNSVFETINCRGKTLDDLDRIRNHFYSHFKTSEGEKKNTVHENLERIQTFIRSVRRGSVERASQYMRCHLQCIYGFLQKNNFYRDVRTAIRYQASKQQPLADYILDLTERVAAQQSLELFTGIMLAPNPEDLEFIKDFKTKSGTTKAKRDLAVFLRELRGYKVTQPLVFALLMQYLEESDGQHKRKVARIVNKNISRLASFVLRTAFVAPKFEPSHFETDFSNFARDITIANEVSDLKFAEFLRKCDRSSHNVLDDSVFQEAITEARMTGILKIKHFLLGINSHLQQDSQVINERQCTIEHILPKSSLHWGAWTGFEGVDPADWSDRIGNLTLIWGNDNKSEKKFNSGFEKKKEIYAKSSLKITKNLARNKSWTPKHIQKRQLEMAKLATEVWKFE